MSVKLIDNEAFYGFRVRRTVDGKLYQEYFSLKQSGKRMGVRQTRAVEKIAAARDEVLRLEQEKSRQRHKGERCFHPDGRVKGISYLVKTEKSGTCTPIFQIGIASELEGKIICTSFSINAHGLDQAWGKAIQTYAKHKKISRGSKLYQKLKAAMPEVELPPRQAVEADGHGLSGSETLPGRPAGVVARKRTRDAARAGSAAKNSSSARSRPSARVPAKRAATSRALTKKASTSRQRGAAVAAAGEKRKVRKKATESEDA